MDKFKSSTKNVHIPFNFAWIQHLRVYNSWFFTFFYIFFLNYLQTYYSFLHHFCLSPRNKNFLLPTTVQWPALGNVALRQYVYLVHYLFLSIKLTISFTSLCGIQSKVIHHTQSSRPCNQEQRLSFSLSPVLCDVSSGLFSFSPPVTHTASFPAFLNSTKYQEHMFSWVGCSQHKKLLLTFVCLFFTLLDHTTSVFHGSVLKHFTDLEFLKNHRWIHWKELNSQWEWTVCHTT